MFHFTKRERYILWALIFLALMLAILRFARAQGGIALLRSGEVIETMESSQARSR